MLFILYLIMNIVSCGYEGILDLVKQEFKGIDIDFIKTQFEKYKSSIKDKSEGYKKQKFFFMNLFDNDGPKLFINEYFIELFILKKDEFVFSDFENKFDELQQIIIDVKIPCEFDESQKLKLAGEFLSDQIIPFIEEKKPFKK